VHKNSLLSIIEYRKRGHSMRDKDKQKFVKVYKEIGKRIAFYRKLRGLSQEALADKVDISASHLSKIEAPNTDISFSLDMLLLIAEGLEVDIAAFFNPIEIENPYLKKTRRD
jgi:transcriptional regulator with XRE-family HTH domain